MTIIHNPFREKRTADSTKIIRRFKSRNTLIGVTVLTTSIVAIGIGSNLVVQLTEDNLALPIAETKVSGELIVGQSLDVTATVTGKNSTETPWTLRLQKYDTDSSKWKTVRSTGKNSLSVQFKIQDSQLVRLRTVVIDEKTGKVNYSASTLKPLDLYEEIDVIFKGLDDSIQNEKAFQEGRQYKSGGLRYREYVETIVDPAYFDFASAKWKQDTTLASDKTGTEPLDYTTRTTASPSSIKMIEPPMQVSSCANDKIEPLPGVWFSVNVKMRIFGSNTYSDYRYFADTFKVSGGRLYLSGLACFPG